MLHERRVLIVVGVYYSFWKINMLVRDCLGRKKNATSIGSLGHGYFTVPPLIVPLC